jgi:hypothetical protein
MSRSPYFDVTVEVSICVLGRGRTVVHAARVRGLNAQWILAVRNYEGGSGMVPCVSEMDMKKQKKNNTIRHSVNIH